MIWDHEKDRIRQSYANIGRLRVMLILALGGCADKSSNYKRTNVTIL